MRLLKRFLLFFPISIFLLLLSGCWDRKEVNDLALVTAVCIDKGPKNGVELSVQIYIPKSESSGQSLESSGGGGGSLTLVRSATGEMIADAMAKLQEKLPRHIFWGHTEVFIFNETLAKKGLEQQVDFIIRHPQLRERSQLFISKQKSKDILSLLPPLERDLATVLRELESLKIGMEVTVKDFAEMLISESGDTAVPWIKMLPPEQGKDNMETIAYIAGTAVFKKDKMVGKIDDSVTRGVLWLRNDVRLATVTVKPKGAKGYVTFSLQKAVTELVPKIENSKWKMLLKADAEADIIQNTTQLDMANPVVVKSLQQQLRGEIENKVNLALTHVQKDMKSDIFGFGDAFYRKYPHLWKRVKNRWDDIFPNVKVTIDSNIKIRRQGMNSVLSAIIPKEVKDK